MRVALLSDTHLTRADEIQELLWGHLHGVDLILHAGDVVRPAVIEELERIAPVFGVAGNSDPPAIQQLWPTERVVQVGTFRVGMLHGAGSMQGLMQRLPRTFAGVDAVVFGHTHLPMVEQRGGLLLVNPGSPTAPRGDEGPTFALLHVGRSLSAEIVRI